MRIPPSSFAILLTAGFALHLGAQQNPPPEAASSSPVTNEAPPAQKQKESRPMHNGGSVKPPTFIRQVPPKMDDPTPDPALPKVGKVKSPVWGHVQISLWVDENGDTSHIQVVRSLSKERDEEAVEAVRQYKFNPATKNGKPVKVSLYLDINFQPN